MSVRGAPGIGGQASQSVTMLALAGGVTAAFCFAASNLAATAAARTVGGASTLAWVALWGCGLVVLPVALFANPHELSGKTWWLLALSGLANVVGLRGSGFL